MSTFDAELTTEVVARAAASRKPTIMAIWSGGGAYCELPDQGSVLIGRGEDADLRIDHPSVSRRHAKLVVKGEQTLLEDLGSANGSLVDHVALVANRPMGVSMSSLIELGVALVVLRTSEGTTVPPPAPSSARSLAPSASTPSEPIVVDPQMVGVHRLVALVARSNMSVLLLGETGAGKEILAERIHRLSPRKAGPYVRVNCAALVETLLEAELFGYERGAFTGAVQSKAGLLEVAHGGTIFFDEIGEMPPPVQAKLLRVLEACEVTRVGGVRPRAIDIRVVAATNRDLRQQVAQGRFREDLFFRLDGMSIAIPPLRQRVGEIPHLAKRFAADASAADGRPSPSISAAAMARLIQHSWPGNVRELRNVIRRAVLLASDDGRIDQEHVQFEALGVSLPPSAGGADVRVAPSELDGEEVAERRRILEALERSSGNQAKAAKLLGISRRTLVTKLVRLKIPRPRDPD